ncbi:aldo/keto reductase [Myxococcus llanfairpwllgwyngyllgogerychwyrndrobwllllantysiliogogogochensis]|uniref:Aldo/keto reductase n=1 Tax=Myxococcus llanfairpwllgwyngyllgogerychwyrndrobwllllantysiliogogogochensis TaxID=2590453 RepID=A0A540X7M4_9BACT|nr:aldo/keto reductase [Myxococcus llanfairpwllgwyngyllgogerychwyrndrobwllllantysiliogogogochensis]TQF16674.1 aldo/keto reductase [Myxococcus llanfairpwllgwyngyllgogerychwyrndrobwllllantysiliogogogochensis]
MTTTNRIDSLSRYHLLGRSGLRVSPLALGTMTFGTEWGWGSPKDTAHRLLARYLEAGGNFLDTADGYTNGTSEEIIGDYFAKQGGRDGAVIATKFTVNTSPGDPNAGGNGRKNIHRAVEGSLRRLKTDYLDLYWMHAWDGITPMEEVMSTLTDLVRVGKIRYIGLSDVPAWYFARAQTLAEREGWERVVALQLEYSLVERNIEREHIPAALELGASITPWSPLASGLLSGKYTREGLVAKGEGRLPAVQGRGNPGMEKLFTEKNWRIVDTLMEVARELDKPPAQVALAWVTRRPGVASTIIGATKLEQLEANLRALDVEIPEAQSAKLDAAGRPELVHPYIFFENAFFTSGMFTGGTSVRAEPTWFRPAVR